MFTIDEENTISITRGDVGTIEVRVDNTDGGNYIFQPGDIVRLKVFNKKQHSSIVLVKGHEGTEELRKEIQNYVKSRTAPYKYPRIVEFRESLPKTTSGKIIRKQL